VLAIVLGIVQINLGMLFVPWYLPALTLLGALLILVAFARRRSIVGGLALFVALGLAGLQAYALGVMMKTPPYTGPVKAGSPIPSFTTAFADGRPFTEKDVGDGKPTVMVFFRGRW
jgi:cytochrome oxidase Cu insertion factor (SCO1/SenC/PrrC family)